MLHFMCPGIERHHVNSCETLVTQEDNACLLELEKIKKQIESVKCEVEQQQRKLSHYKTTKNDQYGTCAAVTKNKVAAHDPHVNKYVVEKSRPLTDLEYDPCSNFSSGLSSSTLSYCSVRPGKEREIAPEQYKKRFNHRKGQVTKASHYSDDSDDGTLVIDVPCLEEDIKKLKQVVQTESSKVSPIDSPQKGIREAKQCTDLTTDCVLSTEKNLQTNKQCVRETLKSPVQSSVEAKTGHGKMLRPLENDEEVAASTDSIAPLPVQDADLSATREGTGVDQGLSSSNPIKAEKKHELENVLDDLSACFDDLRNRSETSGQTNDLEVVHGYGFDASDQKDDEEFCCLQEELQVQIASLEKALAEPNKTGQFSLPMASQSYGQHTVTPKQNVQLSDQTTSLFHQTKDTSTGQDIESVTGADWPSVQNVRNEKCPTSLTMQSLDGAPCNVLSMRFQDASMTVSSPNQLLMPQKPLAEPGAGHNDHQAPATLLATATTAVPRGTDQEDFEIFSSSEEDLNYSDLDLSEDDPMEECYKIFMEANKDGDSGIQDPSPVSLMRFFKGFSLNGRIKADRGTHCLFTGFRCKLVKLQRLM